MKEKYYTPKIEELHMNFEMQVFHEGKWEQRLLLKSISSNPNDYSLLKCAQLIEDGRIRVKYLDAEGLVSCGWVQTGAPNEYVTKNNTHSFLMVFSQEHNYIEIYGGLSIAYIASHEDCKIFAGNIKNSSELRKVMEMVGVK